MEGTCREVRMPEAGVVLLMTDPSLFATLGRPILLTV
jgi:hypothetical protein